MADTARPPVKRVPSLLRRFVSRFYAVVAHFLGIWHCVYALLPLVRRRRLLAVFTFHRISTRESERDHLVTYDKGTPAEVFDLQVAGITRHYDVVTLDDFVEIVSGRRRLERNTALITFDDADADFLSCALPVLRKHAVSSVVFVPTDFIDSDKRFWHLRVSNAFQRLSLELWPRVQELALDFPADKGTG